MGGLAPCRFPQGCPGLLTRSSRRPRLAAGALVVANRHPWRPMATAPNAGTDAGCPCASHRSTALFKPFEWVQGEQLAPSLQSHAAFLNEARDLVQGAQTLVQLLEWDEDRRGAASSDADPAPLSMHASAVRCSGFLRSRWGFCMLGLKRSARG